MTTPARIPYDEMRRILGLPDPPFDRGGIPRTEWTIVRNRGAGAVWPGGRIPAHVLRLQNPLTEAEWGAITEAYERMGAVVRSLRPALLAAFEEAAKVARHGAESVDALTPDDQRPHPLHPAIPRPSHTPPMWANNPTRTHRRRNR